MSQQMGWGRLEVRMWARMWGRIKLRVEKAGGNVIHEENMEETEGWWYGGVLHATTIVSCRADWLDEGQRPMLAENASYSMLSV